MKRTKSMHYEETIGSEELLLYVINDGNFYKERIAPLIQNLRSKAIEGLYDADKAVDAYFCVATVASNRHNKEFGYSFSVKDRFSAAVDMERFYRENHVFYGIEEKVSVLEKLHNKQKHIESNIDTEKADRSIDKNNRECGR